ncbi:MAG: porin family protein [Gemmatimonadota bacterium]|nr:porin family protein [Gemmatimonadota bacterium]MDH3426871.1 porin family protein [Gemmatimonadota bacterium]
MRARTLLAILAGALFMLPATANAQVRLGPQLSWGDDTNLGIGGRVLANVGSMNQWDFIGTFDVFFPDDSPTNDVSYWEANGNLAYNFRMPDAPALSPYVGIGLNIAHVSVDRETGDFDDTDLGINFFVGNQFEAGSTTPFAELRVVAEGASQVVLTGGILF